MARVFHEMATYAIISLGGKQYRVREGERLLVDRLTTGEGKTFQPDVLFTGGDGESGRTRSRRQDPHRQATPEERLPPSDRLPRRAVADRDPVDRRLEARR